MNIIELIDKKRQGLEHTQEELSFFIDGVMSGSIPDYQISAWLMAVCNQGLNLDETTWLTDLYVHSGKVLDFSSVDGVVTDKHSTGGVGDKTTLVLTPMLAVCGVKVAKLSGRGLGFTGGTIDKLEAIPGFKVDLSSDQIIEQVKTVGMALGAQTAELVPADGKLYAIRDVTATVSSIPLIAASVLSKKIAAGAQAIVLDIKTGEGALIKSFIDAKSLAFTCREVGKRLGRSISTVISSMVQPLGNSVGNAAEVIEAIKTLQGKGPSDLVELCLTLGGVTLVNARKAATLEEGKVMLMKTIDSGEALLKFAQLIEAQHGNKEVLEDFSLLPQPSKKISVTSPVGGIVEHCDALKIAQAVKVLGGGRQTKESAIDLSVAAILKKKIGDTVHSGEALAELWVNDKGAEEAYQLVLEAYQLVNKPVVPPVLIKDIFCVTENMDPFAQLRFSN